ncbi:unnamed protein product [Rotaria sp. Silwood2]|nr:unnamed protein product [Rotaria sp. Silwood2]
MQSVDSEKIFLVISGKATISIMPEIEQLKQVDSIFIFCFKVEIYQYLLEKYDSIVGIYCERSSFIDSIKQNVELLQKQSNVFNYYNEHEEKATRDISKESAEFLWFQLFKDVLLRMSRNDRAKQELIEFCRQYYRGNQKEYNNIIEFEQSYQSDKKIREKFYDRKHLYTATALNHIGNVYYKIQEYSKSLMYYEKAFNFRQKQLPHVHLDIAASLNNLGLIEWKMNHAYEALDNYRQSLDIRKQLLPSDHNDIIQS